MEMRARPRFLTLLTLLSTVNPRWSWPRCPAARPAVVIAVELILAPIFLGLPAAPGRRARAAVPAHGCWTDLLAAVPFLAVFRSHVAAVARACARARAHPRELTWPPPPSAAIFLVLFVLEMSGRWCSTPRPARANIDASDALWWGYVTITTVGTRPVPGDAVPHRLPRRRRALQRLHLHRRAFLAPRRRRRRLSLAAEPGSIQAELDAIRDLLAESEDHNAALRSRLDALEGALANVATREALAAAPRAKPPAGPGSA
jgi:hypothetical protein